MKIAKNSPPDFFIASLRTPGSTPIKDKQTNFKQISLIFNEKKAKMCLRVVRWILPGCGKCDENGKSVMPWPQMANDLNIRH